MQLAEAQTTLGMCNSVQQPPVKRKHQSRLAPSTHRRGDEPAAGAASATINAFRRNSKSEKLDFSKSDQTDNEQLERGTRPKPQFYHERSPYGCTIPGVCSAFSRRP